MAIPNQSLTLHHSGDVLEDIQMGMRAQDFHHVAFMFENLYERPIDAVIREYATNAWDSHVFAGNTAPIEVTLPTESDLHLTIQDFGVGMSYDTIKEVYANYGASDKRTTNAVAGQLGMGSKSGLAYATAFMVTAVYNGVQTSVMSTKDNHGLGVLKVLDTMATNKPNGVQIRIPVDRYDVDRFREAAESLFQFWTPGTVLVDGEAPSTPAWMATSLPLDEHTTLVRTDQGLYSSYVTMGNVPYPVDDIYIDRSTVRFVAHLNIGDVDFAPSREGVRHTPHTDKTLSELTEHIKDNYGRAIRAAMAKDSTPWDETLLKVLWMDRNLSLRPSNGVVWTYTPNHWGHRKATGRTNVSMSTLAQPNVVVITGFEAQNVSTAARQRLLDFVPNGQAKTFIILPTGTPGLGALEGRPNTFAWADIVGATKVDPVTKQRVKTPKVETRYATNTVPMTGAELAAITDRKILYVEPDYHASHGNLGDAVIVSLRSSNQLPRILRFVPHAAPYHAEVDRLRKAAAKAVTRQDRLIRQARTLPDQYRYLDPNAVIDPELAEAIRLRQMVDTDTLREAARFGVSIEVEHLGARFSERYPLLSVGGYYSRQLSDMADDMVLYINARYEANEAALVGQVAS